MIDYDRAKNDPEYAHKVLLSYLTLGTTFRLQALEQTPKGRQRIWHFLRRLIRLGR